MASLTQRLCCRADAALSVAWRWLIGISLVIALAAEAAAACLPDVPGPGYVAGPYRFVLTKSAYPASADLDRAVRQAFGAGAEVAEWSELKRLLADQREAMAFATALGMRRQEAFECRNYFVRFNGQLKTGPNNYFVARHDGTVPADWAVIDQIGGNTIHLGRWTHASQVLVRLPKAPDLEKAIIPSTEKRVALVVGNAAYRSVPALANPIKDAALVADALRRSGMDVTIVNDADRAALVVALRAFAEKADDADWALIYYAGHGIEVAGVNYVIPVDARLASDRDVSDETVSLDRLLDAVGGARRLRIVVLDACRDNPFAVTMKRSSAQRSIGRGLARVEPPKATLVAYSAKAGSTAADGAGGNSPFAAAFARRVLEPGVEINKVFRGITQDVLSATAQQQEPFTYGSLPLEDFFFVARK